MVAKLIGAMIVSVLVYFYQLEADFLFRKDKSQFEVEKKLNFPGKEAKYDIVIVGGGTAGCLLAGRLSKHFNVLLLEAGGPAPSLTEVPAFRIYSMYDPELNYNFNTTQQKALNNRVLKPTTGKLFGGSFAHNGMIYNRGNEHDYENWARLTKSDDWKWERVWKTFKKLEKYTGPYKNKYRGEKGTIPVRTPNYPILKAYEEAAKELGYSFSDPNGPQKEGFGPSDFNIDGSRGVTTCSVYVDPLLGNRKTLTVLFYSTVTKILFRGTTAVGVKYKRHGEWFEVFASKEVVLSAGVYGSPIALFKSGIGPASILSKAKIPIVVELPVGQNLIEHACVHIPVIFKDSSDLVSVYNITDVGFETYLKGGQDVFMSDPGTGPQAFFVSSVAKKRMETNWPDIQIYQETVVSYGGFMVVPMTVMVTRQRSVGSVSLNTKNYANGEDDNSRLAVIDLNLFENDDDVTVLLEAIGKFTDIFNSAAFQKYGVFVLQDENCLKTNTYGTDGYWMCFLKQNGTNYQHPVGTCRMGYGSEDKNSVVDSDFRVLGVQHLRVVDASVFPYITNANTNAPTFMVAYMASEKIIKTHYRRQKRNTKKKMKFETQS